MRKMTRWAGLLLGCLPLLAASAPLAAQTKEKVSHNLTPAQVEKLLGDMGVKAARSQDSTAQDHYHFDFERNDYKIRLTLAKGRLLWLSAYFPKLSLDSINKWNVNAKFSRAVLVRVGDRDNAVVESHFDAAGGVTDNVFRQFIRRFDGEVKNFDEFQRSN